MNNTSEIEEISPVVSGTEDNYEERTILKVGREGKREIEMPVARESPLTIILNNHELVTLLCSPANPEYLAIGFLFAEGFLNSKKEIRKITVDKQRGIVRITKDEAAEYTHELLFKRLITSACGRGAAFYSTADAQNLTKVESCIVLSANEVFSLVEKFDQRSRLYQMTRGVHSAALSDTEKILVWNDDLGRHNAIDKVFGECLLKDISTEDHIVITSGRTPSEMIIKVAKGKVPIIISLGATTDLGMRLASDLGVTLIGFDRSKEMIVFTNGWRIK